VALPFTLQSILRQKEEELWKLKYFTMQKYHLSKKNPHIKIDPMIIIIIT
jgi:hypothetical protein